MSDAEKRHAGDSHTGEPSAKNRRIVPSPPPSPTPPLPRNPYGPHLVKGIVSHFASFLDEMDADHEAKEARTVATHPCPCGAGDQGYRKWAGLEPHSWTDDVNPCLGPQPVTIEAAVNQVWRRTARKYHHLCEARAVAASAHKHVEDCDWDYGRTILPRALLVIADIEMSISKEIGLFKLKLPLPSISLAPLAIPQPPRFYSNVLSPDAPPWVPLFPDEQDFYEYVQTNSASEWTTAAIAMSKCIAVKRQIHVGPEADDETPLAPTDPRRRYVLPELDGGLAPPQVAEPPGGLAWVRPDLMVFVEPCDADEVADSDSEGDDSVSSDGGNGGGGGGAATTTAAVTPHSLVHLPNDPDKTWI